MTNRRLTVLETMFLRLQSVLVWMKIKRRLNQKMDNILSTNRISTL